MKIVVPVLAVVTNVYSAHLRFKKKKKQDIFIVKVENKRTYKNNSMSESNKH